MYIQDNYKRNFWTKITFCILLDFEDKTLTPTIVSFWSLTSYIHVSWEQIEKKNIGNIGPNVTAAEEEFIHESDVDTMHDSKTLETTLKIKLIALAHSHNDHISELWSTKGKRLLLYYHMPLHLPNVKCALCALLAWVVASIQFN